MEAGRSVAPKNQSFQLILGSSSMARRKILAEMGYDFTIMPSRKIMRALPAPLVNGEPTWIIMTADIDEKSIRMEKPEDLVMVLAEAKADAILMRHKSIGELEKKSRPTLLITADTVVVYQGIIREKPSTEEEARQFIRDYSGGSAQVVGSVFVTNLATGSRKVGWESAEVYFLDIPDEVVDSLVEEGITFSVAGGLTLEHPLTLPLVDTMVGTADCVMGLSKALTEQLIHEAL